MCAVAHHIHMAHTHVTCIVTCSLCATWLIHVCDMIHSCVWHDSFIIHGAYTHVNSISHVCVCMRHEWCMSHVTHMNESCHTHEWVMSHTCEFYKPFARIMESRVHYVRHDSFIYVTWHANDISHSRESCLYGSCAIAYTCLIHLRDMPPCLQRVRMCIYRKVLYICIYTYTNSLQTYMHIYVYTYVYIYIYLYTCCIYAYSCKVLYI